MGVDGEIVARKQHWGSMCESLPRRDKLQRLAILLNLQELTDWVSAKTVQGHQHTLASARGCTTWTVSKLYSGCYMRTKTTRLCLHLMEERKLWGTSWTSTCKPLVLHQYWVPFLNKPSMWRRLFENFLSLKHHFCSPACFLWNYTDNFEESVELHGW